MRVSSIVAPGACMSDLPPVSSMRRLGLTGGIGSGKSAVAQTLRRRGYHVLDADRIARDVVAVGTPGLKAVMARFGSGVVAEDGSLDRSALGALVFASPALREELEALLHPLISAETSARMQSLEEAGVKTVFYEAALLFEAGAHDRVDEVIVVVVPEEVQVARTIARDQCSAAEAHRRIAAQLPLHVKTERADHLLDNSGDLESLEQEVDALLKRLGFLENSAS